MMDQKHNYAVNNAIDGFIKEYSPVFLTKVYGKELADKIIGTEMDSADDQLRKKFESVAEPLADFVMFHILRNTSQRATIDGTVVIKSANTRVSPAVMQANIWNSMVDKLRDFCKQNEQVRVNQDLLVKITPCWL